MSLVRWIFQQFSRGTGQTGRKQGNISNINGKVQAGASEESWSKMHLEPINAQNRLFALSKRVPCVDLNSPYAHHIRAAAGIARSRESASR